MSGNNRNIPGGTRDIMFAEAELYRSLDNRLTEIYKKNGFYEIMTPVIEYYDVFETGSTMGQEQMYKLTDPDGRLLVLRADNTTPIARVAATRLGGVNKLFYHQKVYRLSPGHTGRKSEIAQSGVEILGASGVQSDLLCLITAIETLSSFSDDYKLELGHVGFYNAIISELELEDETAKNLRKLVEAKDINKISDYGKIKKIPFLFGGEEVLYEAKALAGDNKEALAAIAYLEELYTALCQAGYKDKIMIDLGIVHSLDYYTGVVFRGYMAGAASPVLAGGRYDTLISKFNNDIPATGFGVNVSEVADTIIKANRDAKTLNIVHRELVCFDEESLGQALEYTRNSDFAELSPLAGKKENLEYAENAGFSALICFEKGEKKVIKL
ncbi:MAG: ATP phosphoribosyltransferase regulatory subunit [Ruminococcaceae bacterium]|nr:ATP phosphoribosyltransferase regulatory subunit [Oscillospiraceae bacterium]